IKIALEQRQVAGNADVNGADLDGAQSERFRIEIGIELGGDADLPRLAGCLRVVLEIDGEWQRLPGRDEAISRGTERPSHRRQARVLRAGVDVLAQVESSHGGC